jgi:hypothetical protein
MKFRLLTWRAYRNNWQADRQVKLSQWHKKFAWTFIRSNDDPTQVFWLQFVYRKGTFDYYSGKKKVSWSYVENAFDLLKKP